MGMYSRFKGPLSKPGGRTVRLPPVAQHKLPAVVEKLNSLASCERVIEEGAKAFHRVVTAFARIKADHLYKEAGHATFEDYCEKRWGWGRQRGYQLAKAGAMLDALPKKCKPLVYNESQARALAKVPEEKRVNTLKKAARSGSVSPKSIREAAREPKVIDVEPEPDKSKVCPTCKGSGRIQ
jgi:hypothetical protein